ncbi:MAG: hypothetical protein FJ102_07675 [Deltaproteobacteria bacterium]|nr:hypothetical protein [Deltaproteobacteria bacterium]
MSRAPVLALLVPALLGCAGLFPADAADALAGEWYGVIPCGSDAAVTLDWDLTSSGGGDLDGRGSLRAERAEDGEAFYIVHELGVDAEDSGAQELEVTGTVESCEGNDNSGDGLSCDPLAAGSVLFVTGEFTWDGADAIDVDIEGEEIGNVIWECHGGMERD